MLNLGKVSVFPKLFKPKMTFITFDVNDSKTVSWGLVFVYGLFETRSHGAM